MAITYEQSGAVDETVQNMVSSESFHEFHPLREQDIRLLGILKTTTKGRGEDEDVVAGSKQVEVKKIGPLHQAVINAHYLVVFDAYFWQNADQRTREARLHRALMGIEVAEGGKLKARAPDVVEYRATLVRYGQYTEELTSVAEVLRGAITAAGNHVAERVRSSRVTPAVFVPPPPRGRRRGATAAPVAVTPSGDEFADNLHEQVMGLQEVGDGEEE